MTLDKFRDFWDKTVNEWLANEEIVKENNKEVVPVKDLCKIRETIDGKNAVEYIHTTYEMMKNNTKRYYFKPTDCSQGNANETRLSRYKRAAVLTYAVLMAEPLCDLSGITLRLDPYFLKQRLAFYLALSIIIQDYDSEKTKEWKNINPLDAPVFSLDNLGKSEKVSNNDVDDDSFLLSVYKDLFFAEHYDNYNVLTMANVYGLLTEFCSKLPAIGQRKKQIESPIISNGS